MGPALSASATGKPSVYLRPPFGLCEDGKGCPSAFPKGERGRSSGPPPRSPIHLLAAAPKAPQRLPEGGPSCSTRASAPAGVLWPTFELMGPLWRPASSRRARIGAHLCVWGRPPKAAHLHKHWHAQSAAFTPRALNALNALKACIRRTADCPRRSMHCRLSSARTAHCIQSPKQSERRTQTSGAQHGPRLTSFSALASSRALLAPHRQPRPPKGCPNAVQRPA